MVKKTKQVVEPAEQLCYKWSYEMKFLNKFKLLLTSLVIKNTENSNKTQPTLVKQTWFYKT